MVEDLKKELSASRQTSFSVKIIPKSTRNQIVGTYGEYLKIKIAAVAAKNKANEQLIGFLSEIFDVPKSCVEIVSGHTSPIKHIKIHALPK